MLAAIESIRAFVMRPHRNRFVVWWMCVSECVDFFWEVVDGDGDVNVRCACVREYACTVFACPPRPPINQLEFPL